MIRFYSAPLISLGLLVVVEAPVWGFSPIKMIDQFMERTGLQLSDQQKGAILALGIELAGAAGEENLAKLGKILDNGKVEAKDIPGLLRIFADVLDKLSTQAGTAEKALEQLKGKLKAIGITDAQLAQVLGLGKGSHIPSDPLFKASPVSSVPLQSAWERIGLTAEVLQKLHAKKPQAPLVVAMIDTGIDYLHPDLRGQLWVNPKEKHNGKDDDGNGYIDDINGFNFAEMNGNILDFHGHGTYAAGLIAGNANKVGIAGVNPHVRLMILKDTNKRGQEQSLSTALAIDYAIRHGARIIHLSNTYPKEAKAVEIMVQRALKKGLLVVCTANSRSRNTANVIPASVPGALTVGALDRKGRRCAFSGWGAGLDLMAPGTDIPGPRAWGTDFLTLMAGRDPEKEGSNAIVEKKWYLADGTCSAAPLVTGVASLIWQCHPELTAEQVRHKLLMSCDDLGHPGWDKTSGRGRLNAKKALGAGADHYLSTRISGVTVEERKGQNVLKLEGEAVGSHYRRGQLQLGYGIKPKEWITVHYSQLPTKGVLGLIPVSRLAHRPGRWSLRSVVDDTLGRREQATVTVKVNPGR